MHLVGELEWFLLLLVMVVSHHPWREKHCSSSGISVMREFGSAVTCW